MPNSIGPEPLSLSLPTPDFFYGLQSGKEIAIDFEECKTLIFRFLTIENPHTEGTRIVFFELNGQPSEVTITDNSLKSDVVKAVKADPSNKNHVGSTMPGMVVAVKPGDAVKKGQKLSTLEALKMEIMINAEQDRTVSEVQIKAGAQVETGDLPVVIE